MKINIASNILNAKKSMYQRVNRFRFDLICKRLLGTRPISPKPDGILIISLVSHRDVMMYLVAALSFYYYFKRGSFVLINDGTLTANDIALVRKLIVGIEVVHAEDVNKNSDVCPKGGCWERLVYAADRNHDNYCIILDADTITQHELPEVEDCVNKNVPFIIPGGPEAHLKPMKQIWEELYPKLKGMDFSSKWDFQGQFDLNLNRIVGFEDMSYIKGSGGFQGHSMGEFSRARLEKFSQDMETIFNQDWHGWSSEQSTACVLIANVSGATELPYNKYALYWDDDGVDYPECNFIHFITPCRFKNSFYIDGAKKFIEKYAREYPLNGLLTNRFFF